MSDSLDRPAPADDPLHAQEAALRRISLALGFPLDSPEFADIPSLLEQAADRLEKAATLMADLQVLRDVAAQQGFAGSSAAQLVSFIRGRLHSAAAPVRSIELTAQTLKQISQACERLDPDFAFHPAHLMNEAGPLLSACLLSIAEAGARVQAQATTIAVLTEQLKSTIGQPENQGPWGAGMRGLIDHFNARKRPESA